MQVLDFALQHVNLAISPIGNKQSENNAGNLHDVEQAQRLGLSQIVREQVAVNWLYKNQGREYQQPESQTKKETPSTHMPQFVTNNRVHHRRNYQRRIQNYQQKISTHQIAP